MENSNFGEKSDFCIIKHLGEGSTSDVYLCALNSKKYAIKILKDIPIAKTSFLQETQALSEINHPLITNLITSGISKIQFKNYYIEKPYILLELAEKGELFNYIFHPKKGFSEREARFLFKQILQAIRACHEKKIAHLDIKTENIMLDSNWNVKIADFGLSTILYNNSIIDNYLGTESFLAPEVINKKPYDPFKADIFALGVTLFIILAGKTPFKSAKKFDIHYQYYIKKRQELFWKIIKKNNCLVNDFSSQALDLFNKLFEPDPNLRISIDQIMNHPWMSMETASRDEMETEFKEREKIIIESIKSEQETNSSEINKIPFFKITIDCENLEHSN